MLADFQDCGSVFQYIHKPKGIDGRLSIKQD